MVSMTATWERTSAFVAANLRDLAIIASLGIVLPTAGAAIVAPLAQTGSPSDQLGANLAQLISVLMTAWAQLGIIALVLVGGGVAGAMAAASRRFLPLIGVAFIIGLGFVVSMLPFIIVLVASGVTPEQMQAGGGADQLGVGGALVILLWFVIWLPLLIFAIARLALVNPVILVERRFLDAVARSWALTRGHTFKLVAVILLYGVLLIVASMAAAVVFGSIGVILSGGVTEGVTIGTVFTAIPVSIVTATLAVFSTVFIAELYRGLTGANKGI